MKRLLQCHHHTVFPRPSATKIIILTQSSVSQENSWKLCYPKDLTNECAEIRLLQCLWQPFQDRLATKTNILMRSSVSLETWKICSVEASPLSMTNSLFKTILLLKLSHCLNALSHSSMVQSFVSKQNGFKHCHPGDLNNECTEASLCHLWMPFTRPSSE